MCSEQTFSNLIGRLIGESTREAGSSGTSGPDDTLPPMSHLAFIGDAVYELWVRICVSRSVTGLARLHSSVVELVRAESQASILKRIEEQLTEAERDVVRRARNQKMGQVPKSASPGQYRLASALEALFGYLLWTGQIDRLMQILKMTNE